ncbi:MAG: hypothetical protein K0Q94_355 [Paenibacillus sp.]|uniref:Uncharacterized protein n=1 Tax=Paenibacillus hemerocallicola TaxID=1172614 RepID=A0A5C4T8K0_9BACL|nr:hypothetical protein [Paenibacillus hemerocallicola]MDF2657564.1 hypothetical protein [Paenibacillus sp.]TNJ64870.1 hypothetical protein FE784_17715 [Paenibacillus hemerocallicola]
MVPQAAGCVPDEPYYDASDVKLSSIQCALSRGTTDTTTPLNTECIVLTPPAGTAKVGLKLMNASSYSTNAFDIVSVTLHEVRFVAGKEGRTGDYKKLHQTIDGALRWEGALEVPVAGVHYANFKAGDELQLPPAEGAPVGYICTADGRPGTWRPLGTIGESP